MKITPKKYAESLYQAIQEKKDGKVKPVIENFVKLLVKNNDLSKTDDIISEFIKFWNRKKGIVEAEVISAGKLDGEIVKLLNCYIAKLSRAKEIILDNIIDKTIIGGVIIRYEDKIFDGSLRNRLKELKSRMMK